MITIQIKLYATLAPFLPERADAFQVDDGTTVEQLIVHLKIPAAETKLIFINGRKASFDTRLKHGDRIGIFPPVGGG